MGDFIFFLTFCLGGHNIKRLMAETGVQVTPHPDDVGTWTIFAPNRFKHKRLSNLLKEILYRLKNLQSSKNAIN